LAFGDDFDDEFFAGAGVGWFVGGWGVGVVASAGAEGMSGEG
jgi:hypothetical protein